MSNWMISQMVLNGYDVWADDIDNTDEPDDFDDYTDDDDNTEC